MKILGKNVFIGNLRICTELISKAVLDDNNKYTGDNKVEYKSKIVAENVVYLLDHLGSYVDIRDTEGMERLAMMVYGAAPRFHTAPTKPGEEFVADLKPYFDEKDFEKPFKIHDILEEVKQHSNCL